jgi:hypothetical protein
VVERDRAARRGTPARRQADTPFGQPWPLDAWPDELTPLLLAATNALAADGSQRLPSAANRAATNARADSA